MKKENDSFDVLRRPATFEDIPLWAWCRHGEENAIEVHKDIEFGCHNFLEKYPPLTPEERECERKTDIWLASIGLTMGPTGIIRRKYGN